MQERAIFITEIEAEIKIKRMLLTSAYSAQVGFVFLK